MISCFDNLHVPSFYYQIKKFKLTFCIQCNIYPCTLCHTRSGTSSRSQRNTCFRRQSHTCSRRLCQSQCYTAGTPRAHWPSRRSADTSESHQGDTKFKFFFSQEYTFKIFYSRYLQKYRLFFSAQIREFPYDSMH